MRRPPEVVFCTRVVSRAVHTANEKKAIFFIVIPCYFWRGAVKYLTTEARRSRRGKDFPIPPSYSSRVLCVSVVLFILPLTMPVALIGRSDYLAFIFPQVVERVLYFPGASESPEASSTIVNWNGILYRAN